MEFQAEDVRTLLPSPVHYPDTSNKPLRQILTNTPLSTLEKTNRLEQAHDTASAQRAEDAEEVAGDIAECCCSPVLISDLSCHNRRIVQETEQTVCGKVWPPNLD